MAKETTNILNEENMSPKEARNYIRENAERQKKILTIAGDNRKYIIDALREKNHNDPKLQQAIKINDETLETIRNYAAAKLNKKPEELNIKEWKYAVKDFYKKNNYYKEPIHLEPSETVRAVMDMEYGKNWKREATPMDPIEVIRSSLAPRSKWEIEDDLKKEECSIELPDWLPAYAYEVDKNFKNETGNGRNPDMMKKIDEAVLDMRKDWILKTEAKDWWVYTTIKFPWRKPIHFLEPDFSRCSDEEYKESNKYSYWYWWHLSWLEHKIYQDGIKLWWMKWKIDKWENKKLKKYVQECWQEWLYLAKISTLKRFMKELADFVNRKYNLNISNEKNRIDLFCRSMNSIWYLCLADVLNYRFWVRFSFIHLDVSDDLAISRFLTDYNG